MAIPRYLLLTDGWSGLPSNSQPVTSDGRLTGTDRYEAPGNTITWSWDLQGSESRSFHF